MKSFAKTCLLLTAFLLVAAGPAAADEVRLKNGDRLTGTVIEMSQGKLVLKTSYAGEIKIKWSQVAGLTSDQPLKIETVGGQMRQARVAPAQPGQLQLAGGPALPLAQVVAINPEDKEPLKISGQVNLGVDISRGNTNKQNLDGTGRAVATWKTLNRAIAGFEIHKAQSKGVDTSDNSLGYLEYNRFVSQKWYWLANLRVEQDRFKNVNFRGMAGPGIGYQVWESKLTNLSFELGPDYVYQEETGGADEDWFAWRWQISYDRWFFGDFVQFYHRQTGFLAVDNFDNFIWSARQGLNFPLKLGFVTTLSYNIDYDNQPEPGKSRTDTRLILSLGYQW